MKDLLNFMLKNILGEGKFRLSEKEEEGRVTYLIQTESAQKGLVIGKGGRMISALRNIIKVRAVLKNQVVNLQVTD